MNTNYFINLIAGNIFRTKTSPSIPTNYYIGLSSTEPTVDGVCTGEPSRSGTGYSRVKLSNLSTPSNGVISNASNIDFNESLSSWGQMRYYVVYDSETGGNLLFGGALKTPITVDAGTAVILKTGEFKVRICTPTA